MSNYWLSEALFLQSSLLFFADKRKKWLGTNNDGHLFDIHWLNDPIGAKESRTGVRQFTSIEPSKALTNIASSQEVEVFKTVA